MPRSTGSNDSGEPTPPDRRAWRYFGDGFAGRIIAARLQAFNATSLAYEDVTLDNATGGIITSGGGGGGGGAVTVADGADVAQGTTTDLSSASTVVGLLKAIKAFLAGTISVSGSLGRSWTLSSGTDSVSATDGGGSLTVDAPVGTPLWVRLSDGAAAFVGQKAMAASVPVVIASDQSSLPTTEARLPTALGANGGLKIEGVASGVAVPVSAASLPLPSGAAKDSTLTDGTQRGSMKLLDSAGTNAASISAAGAVKVDASGVAVPVTDNAGSLTVDAPVGTPVWVRLSDGSAAFVGQKAMAASIPVVLASDQASVPVAATLAAETTKVIGTVNQGTSPWAVSGGANVFHIDDNSGSVTVDAPVGTPVFTRLSDGAAALIGSKVSASSLPVVIASDQAAVAVSQSSAPWTVKGDQARASATIPNPIANGARSATYPTKPASVTAGQLVDLVADTEGVLYTRPRQVATYVSIYRAALAGATSHLAFTFTANTDKQLATIFHANTATKNARIRRVWVQIISTGAVAGEVQLELRYLSSASTPATGNPAITPAKRNPASAAAEATCLALPTTPGTDSLSNSPIASSILNLAASAGTASGTGLVPQDPGWIKLYDEASADDEEEAPLIRAANAEGYAVIGRSTAAVPLNFIVRVVFTEE